MNITLNEKESRLKELLMVLPPDFDSIENLLSQDAYTVENISKVGTDFAWDCVEECWDCFWENEVVRNENVMVWDSNQSKCRCPVGICLPPAGRRQHYTIIESLICWAYIM